MPHSANDTLLLDGPVERKPLPRPTPDRTADLVRIVRRALRNPASDSALSRALRAAVARATPNLPATASEDEALRVGQVASRMAAVLARHGAVPAPCSPHRETVRD